MNVQLSEGKKKKQNLHRCKLFDGMTVEQTKYAHERLDRISHILPFIFQFYGQLTSGTTNRETLA